MAPNPSKPARPLPKHRFVFLTLQNYSLIALSSAVEALRMANRVAGQEVYEWTLTHAGRPAGHRQQRPVHDPDRAD